MGHKIKTIKELIKSPIEINNFKFLPFLLLPNKVAKKIILK